MANLFSYIEKYGNKTFEEKEFNELDNLVFSAIAYLEFNGIVSSTRKTISLHDAIESFLKRYTFSEYSKYGVAQTGAYKLSRKIKDTNRYKNLKLYHYVYIGTKEKQFSALCIKVKKDLTYVSFEGTDHLISGWREDFQMVYKFPVPAQVCAINYLNRSIHFCDEKVIVGGHSKGGNLAMVSSMYSNYFVNRKIIAIYNNDGPGLRKEQIESKKYKKIKDRLIHIIPNYSIFGLLLRHGDDYKIVKSIRRDIYAHSIFTWIIEDDKLVECKLSNISKSLDESIISWLDEHDDIQKKVVIDAIFDTFDKAGVTEFKNDFTKIKAFVKFLFKIKTIDASTRELIRNFILFNFKYVLNNQIKKKG